MGIAKKEQTKKYTTQRKEMFILHKSAIESSRLLNAGVQIESRAKCMGILGGQRIAWTCFSPSISVFSPTFCHPFTSCLFSNLSSYKVQYVCSQTKYQEVQSHLNTSHRISSHKVFSSAYSTWRPKETWS